MDVTATRSHVVQTTLLLVLSAEAALFGTLVMSYLFLRTNETGTPFSQAGPVDLLIASLNTLVLLASAVLVWRADQAIQAGRQETLINSLWATLILGAIFISGQVFEFSHSGLRIDDSIFSGAFFALISFHAGHVLAGMTFLGLNLARARLGDFNARRHLAITAGAWFWTFVAAVWVVLFAVLFLI